MAVMSRGIKLDIEEEFAVPYWGAPFFQRKGDLLTINKRLKVEGKGGWRGGAFISNEFFETKAV